MLKYYLIMKNYKKPTKLDLEIRKKEAKKAIETNDKNFYFISKLLNSLFLEIEPNLNERKQNLIFEINDKNKKELKSKNEEEVKLIEKILNSFHKLRISLITKINELEVFLFNARNIYRDNIDLIQNESIKDKVNKEEAIIYGNSRKGNVDENKIFDKFLIPENLKEESENFINKILEYSNYEGIESMNLENKFSNLDERGLIDFANKILYFSKEDNQDKEINFNKKLKLNDKEYKEKLKIKNDFTKFLIFLAPNIYKNYDFSFLPDYNNRENTKQKFLLQYNISVNNIRNKYLKKFYNKENFEITNNKIEKWNKEFIYFDPNIKKFESNGNIRKSLKKDIFFLIEAIFIWTRQENRKLIIDKIISLGKTLKKYDNNLINKKLINNLNKIENIYDEKTENSWKKILNSNISFFPQSNKRKRRMYNNYYDSIKKLINKNKDEVIKKLKRKFFNYLLMPEDLKEELLNNEFNEAKVKTIINFNYDLYEIISHQYYFFNLIISKFGINNENRELHFKKLDKIENLIRHPNNLLWKDKNIFPKIEEEDSKELNKGLNKNLIEKISNNKNDINKIISIYKDLIVLYNKIIKYDLNKNEFEFEIKTKKELGKMKNEIQGLKNNFLWYESNSNGMIFSLNKYINSKNKKTKNKKYMLDEAHKKLLLEYKKTINIFKNEWIFNKYKNK